MENNQYNGISRQEMKKESEQLTIYSEIYELLKMNWVGKRRNYFPSSNNK